MAARTDPTARPDEPTREAAVGMDHPTVVPVNFEGRRREDER